MLKLAEAAEPDLVGHAVGHHDEEGLDLAFGDQVVHDQVGVALVAPGGFILAPAVLQVQHRISLGRVLVVVRAACRQRRGVAVLVLFEGKRICCTRPWGTSFEGVEVLVVGGDFNAAFPTGRTVEVQGAGIVECPPINREMVVVEAFIQRPRRADPGAILALGQRGASARRLTLTLWASGATMRNRTRPSELTCGYCWPG